MKHEKHFREVREMADSYKKNHSQKWNEININRNAIK